MSATAAALARWKRERGDEGGGAGAGIPIDKCWLLASCPSDQRVLSVLLFVFQVVEAKHEKLGGVVRKVFSRMGTIAEDGLTHPFDQTTGLTKGFAFVNFLNPQDAKQAAATLNGWQLDKSHNIKVRVETIVFSPATAVGGSEARAGD